MTGTARSLVIRFMVRAYALMILAYPRAFRRDFGREMYLTFRSEVLALSERAGSYGLFLLFLRILLDLFVTLFKEHFDMPKRVITVAMILLLLVVDWLTFHDLFESHTVRDYLTLAESSLVFLYVSLDVLRSDNSTVSRAG